MNIEQIEIAGPDLAFRTVAFADQTPSGGQLADAAGFSANDFVYVLQIRANGELEDVRTTESVSLREGHRFIIAESDRSYRLAMDGDPMDWPSRFITPATLRKLAGVPTDHAIYLELTDGPDRLLAETEIIDLDRPGVERFKRGKKESWKLNVQGKVIEADSPTITVKEAMEQAGFDATQAWIIILKVAGESKREVQATDVIDLRTPGIEKLRLTPRHVENGEAALPSRREFPLSNADEAYLDALGCPWDTIVDPSGRRWLVLRGYAFPDGYVARTADIALEIPTLYPGAQIDMFYVHPPAQLTSGGQIPRTESTEQVEGRPFQRWSRHRTAAAPWNPKTDNVATHLALVESAILKEVGQ